MFSKMPDIGTDAVEDVLAGIAQLSAHVQADADAITGQARTRGARLAAVADALAARDFDARATALVEQAASQLTTAAAELAVGLGRVTATLADTGRQVRAYYEAILATSVGSRPEPAAADTTDYEQRRGPMTEPAETSPASQHMARDMRREIVERVLHGKIPREVTSWGDLREKTRRDLLDDARERAEEDGHDPTAADDEAAGAAVDAWLRTGATATLRTNLDDPDLPEARYRAGVRAFNRRAAALARPTATSRRLAAAIQAAIVGEILSGRIRWDARRLSAADRRDLLAAARDELGLSGGDSVVSSDLVGPVDLAALAEVDEWLRTRPIPAAPPRTPQTHQAAQDLQVAIINAVNAGRYDRGSYTARSRRRALPTSVDGLGDVEELLGRKLRFEDKPVLDEVDAWLAAGMQPAPPGAPPLQPDLPADDLEKVVRDIGTADFLPLGIRMRLPDELRNLGVTDPRNML